MSNSSIGQDIRKIRTSKGLSMEALSDMSGVSLRTIQRIENGESTPRGYTLNQITKALEIDIEELTKKEDSSTNEAEIIKWINLSALLILFLPLTNIIAPLIIWVKYKKHELVRSVGAKILNFHITWLLITSMALLAAPFSLRLFEESKITELGSIIFTYIIFWIYNIFATTRIAKHIANQDWDKVYPKAPKLL